MRYDWQESIPYEIGSRDFFAEIDRRFFQSAASYLPCRRTPFDPLIDFASLSDQDVLEIGVGAGSHAQLLAGQARPGGRATAMIYHGSFWKYWVETILVRGLLQGKLLRGREAAELLHHLTDGAIALHYRVKEWEELVTPHFAVEKLQVLGQKADLVLLPPGKLKDAAQQILPDSGSRFFTNRLGQGSFLVAQMRRK